MENTEKELNKKLAEHFKLQGDCWNCKGQGESMILGRCSVCKGSGELPLSDPLICPDFTQSFDACLEWLIPQAIKEFGARAVYFVACGAMYESIYKKYFSSDKTLYDGKPALVFCRELKKLISSKKKAKKVEVKSGE